MIPTIEYIEKKFEEFDRQMFGGQLPKIPVELSDAKTFIGKCVYRQRMKPDGSVENYDFRLRINTRIDLPEQEVEDTIIHEMIHYYIRWKNLKDTSSHGQIFRHMMDSINQKYNRNVTIRHMGTKEQNEQAIDKRQHWHVVAVVRFKGGRTGIKVLPRIMSRIIDYNNAVIAHPDVAGIDLYMSKDVYFNRFPNSSAFKVHYVEASVLTGHLADAKTLRIDGDRVIIDG